MRFDAVKILCPFFCAKAVFYALIFRFTTYTFDGQRGQNHFFMDSLVQGVKQMCARDMLEQNLLVSTTSLALY